jgi:ABC-type bacteriocin/lantibiotic exporter with double-glycine peptidase domain
MIFTVEGNIGSGKTTFINIISGLLQIQGGNFKINDKKFNFNNYSISNSIGYVPQKVSILNNTILFNITLENQIQKIDLNRVYKILKIVYLSDFVKKFSNGINAILKENGSNISGGQIQRIGIARALYRNPYLLILDEATNALDDNTERLILKKLYKYLEDKIIIAISHKNSILKFSNKIFKIENQKIYTVK